MNDVKIYSSFAHSPKISKIPREQPSLSTKYGRLKRELKAWLKSGAKLASSIDRRKRLAICQQCDFYNPKGNARLGACTAPGCGCTRLKLALATSKCPVGKWNTIS